MSKKANPHQTRPPPKGDSKAKWLGPNAPTARRLRVIQHMMKKPIDAEFARWLGINKSRIGNVFNGAPVGKDLAFIVLQKTGVDPNWLWFGNRNGMTVQLLLALDEADAELTGKDTTR